MRTRNVLGSLAILLALGLFILSGFPGAAAENGTFSISTYDQYNTPGAELRVGKAVTLTNVPAGFNAAYENVGARAGENDRCYNGGTIVNHVIPKTGDSFSPALWLSLALACAACARLLAKGRRARQ